MPEKGALALTRDALDELREWVKQHGPGFGELKPRLVIHNYIVQDVYIELGDVKHHLKAVNSIDKGKEKKPLI